MLTLKLLNKMYTVENYNFKGKKAIVRVDFNVPLNKETLQVSDDTRIRGALKTIKKIMDDGGAAILMSHLGRPKDGPENKFSLKHVIPTLSALTGKDIQFADDCLGESAKKLSSELKPGEILLLENLRFYKEEEGKVKKDGLTEEEVKEKKAVMKEKQKKMAQQLASYADVYVNDAFGTAHRAHASTAIIADFFPTEKLFGYLMVSELSALEKVLSQAERPFTAIMGGAKVSDKILVIENLIDKVDNLIIGGGMTYTFIKAQGGNIGKSLCEEDKLELALEVIKKAKDKGVNLILPVDQVIADNFSNDAQTATTKITEGKDGWMGLDIAEDSVKLFSDVIENSKTILWNGPMGVFEMEKFQKGTVAIAQAIAKATSKGAYSLVGGGDSVAAVNKFKLADKVSYVSTGGGAMLEYIEGKVLPGVKAIRGK